MALPVPNLDDRRFQDLVDDAKRLVQQRCPEWTDHNVSDPGVTLIETFAWMTDQVLYRLNRIPERNYIKFLELIGVRLFPPPPRERRSPSGSPDRNRGPYISVPEPRPPPFAPRPTRLSSSRGSATCPSSPALSPVSPLRSPVKRRSATTPRHSRRAPRSSASTRCQSRMTCSWSASRRPYPRAPSPCASGAISRAWVSIPKTRRWSGKPGMATPGHRAKSTGTAPAASTGTATSCCTSPRATPSP